MISRILAQVVTTRLRNWSEKHGAFDDNQDGFRRGRSTADAVQTAIRIREDSRRLEESSRDRACLLDLRKAYSRVNGPVMKNIGELRDGRTLPSKDVENACGVMGYIVKVGVIILFHKRSEGHLPGRLPPSHDKQNLGASRNNKTSKLERKTRCIR